MIIGICGLIGSGKGAISDILVDEHDFQKMSVADPLKDGISAMFGYDRTMLEGDTEVSRKWREVKDDYWSDKMGRYITPRMMMQEIGTDALRKHFHENIWSDLLHSRLMNSSGNVVVPDIRFKSEMDIIKGIGGILIRVERGPRPEWYQEARWNNSRLSTNPTHIPAHESEWAHIFVKWHYTTTINNDGTLDDLRDKITNTMKRFG